ncbi:type I polyketide synthase [Streptomyces sp. NPDC002446]
MTTREDKQTSATAMKRAYLTMERLQRRIDDYERARTEPIAIVGVGCRFPGGVTDPDSYWELLTSGTDAITEVPADRWDLAEFYTEELRSPGKINTRWGGFVDHIDRFDHDFFGISRREAVSMDPQQRLILEVAWQALEHAGVPPTSLAGSQTGVFLGLASNDYASEIFQHPVDIAAHASTGTAHSIATGRVSYLLDLRGPSVAVDTACSSSLVAVHQACQSLRLGECDLALGGGVNAVLSPQLAISFSQFPDMLSVDGRCKAFDASADGFVRSEGCGIVVLKRLSDALRDQDRVLAVLRGSAINQDGRSSGLTAPNGAAQRAVLERAVAAAGVDPHQVGYVETHGTGTKLGDPIEVEALAEVYGHEEGAPVYLGAAKTNIGHLEAASGVAGLIKAALCVDRGAVPANLHFDTLNPHITLDGTTFTVPTRLTEWPQQEGRRLAAVSSFGFSGTNAHVIVEQAPDRVAPSGADNRPRSVLTLSAKSEKSLLKLARRYQDRLASAEESEFADVCFAGNTGRAHFAHRLAAVGSSSGELAGLLGDFVRGDETEGLLLGEANATGASDVVFLFTGQGPQRVGMARELFRTQPAFRRTLERCDEILRPVLDTPLLTALYPEDPEDPAAIALINDMEYAQPALFAVEYALAELWRSWGVEPAAVVGHSLGEYAAACFAGAMPLEDGLRLAAERGRLLQQLAESGSMAAVFAPASDVAEVLSAYEESQISVAAVNGPANTAISGEREIVAAVCETFTARGVDAKQLRISTSSHSPLVEPVLEPLRRALEKVEFAPPRIPLVANLTGRLWPWDKAPDVEYWLQHARQPVLFADSVRTLHEMGYRTFLEVGPAPILLGLTGEILAGDDEVLMLPSLRPKLDDWEVILGSVSELYVRGAALDWHGFDRDYPRSRVELPHYPFDATRVWHEPSGAAEGPFDWGRQAGAPAAARRAPAPSGESSGRAGNRRTAPGRSGAGRSAAGRAAAPRASSRTRSGASGGRSLAGKLPTAEELLRLPAAERPEALMTQLVQSVQAALGSKSTSTVGMDEPLSSLGLDSLMAVELRNAIQGRLGVSIAIASFLRGATVRTLSEQITGQLTGADGRAGGGAADEDQPIRRAARSQDLTAELLAKLEELPEEPVGTPAGSEGSDD